MNKTKIDWCTMSWNPVTGCLHKCDYCYAHKITKRFCTKQWDADGGLHVLDEAKKFDNSIGGDFDKPHYIIDNYPYNFDPTFHKYRLNEPARIKKPQTIFVCSMADLFGEWVPDEWIEKVFEACKKNPHHRYLFLTKNPERYKCFLHGKETLKNFWFGSTVTLESHNYYYHEKYNTFISIEPIQSSIEISINTVETNWIIIGRETGNRKDKIIPKKEWIENIVNYCKEKNVPVFMKNSLKDIWQKSLIQEYPY